MISSCWDLVGVAEQPLREQGCFVSEIEWNGMLRYMVSRSNSYLYGPCLLTWRRRADYHTLVAAYNIPLMTINKFSFPNWAKYSLLSVSNSFWHIFVTTDATVYFFGLGMLIYDPAKCNRHSSADCAWKERLEHTGAIESSAIVSFGGVLLKMTKAVSSKKMNEKVLYMSLEFLGTDDWHKNHGNHT